MTSMATLQERLEAATADLALCRSDRQVAKILRAEEIKGTRRQCRGCPIALLVAKRLGGEYEVRVEFGLITAETTIAALDADADAEIKQPDAVGDFVGNFDDGSPYLQDLAVVTS